MFKIKKCFLTTEAHNSPYCIGQYPISDMLIPDHESAQSKPALQELRFNYGRNN